MSDGRVELGLGAGWNAREHAAYGIPFPDTGERFELLEEQLAILTGLWTTPLGASFSFDGTHYTVEDSPALPKPVQRPHPPIVIGGFGAEAHAAPGRDVRLPSSTWGFAPLADVPGGRGAGGRLRASALVATRDPRHQHRQHGRVRRGRRRGGLRRAEAIGRYRRPTRRRIVERPARWSTLVGVLPRRRRRHRVLPGARPARPRPPPPAGSRGGARVQLNAGAITTWAGAR